MQNMLNKFIDEKKAFVIIASILAYYIQYTATRIGPFQPLRTSVFSRKPVLSIDMDMRKKTAEDISGSYEEASDLQINSM